MAFCKYNEKENKLEFIVEEIFYVDSVEQLIKKPKFLNYMKYLHLVYDNGSFLVRGKKRLKDRIEKSLEYTKLTEKDLSDELYLKVEDSFKWWNYTNSMKIRDRLIENVEKLLRYTETADLEEQVADGRGGVKLLHDATKIATISEKIVDLQTQIKTLDAMIEVELEDKGKARGGKSSSPLERGLFKNKYEELLDAKSKIKQQKKLEKKQLENEH